jgi:hypothetical protein
MLARVVICYRDTILDVAHVGTGQRFTIGESPAASWIVSLPEADLFEVVRMTKEGAWVSEPLRRSRTLVQLGEAVRLELGEISLHVSVTVTESLTLGRRAVDWGLVASMAAAFGIAAVFALLMRLTPELEDFDVSTSEPAYARYLLRPQSDALPIEPPRPKLRPQIPECGEGEVGAGAGARASRDPSGRAGQKRLQQPRLQQPRLQKARPSAPSREVDPAGILAVMARPDSFFLSPYEESRFAVGDDDENVWGSLDGSVLAEGYGVGGLGVGGMGLVGTGRYGGGGGGGGSSEGTIGLGNIGLIGIGGVATGCPVCKPRVKVTPRIRAERPSIEGARDVSTVQRVTKAKTSQLQDCYDAALGRVPKLKGELELQYVIAPDGTVSTVLVEQSPDRAVGGCVAKVLRHSRFPAASSSTIVNQTITLDPR